MPEAGEKHAAPAPAPAPMPPGEHAKDAPAAAPGAASVQAHAGGNVSQVGAGTFTVGDNGKITIIHTALLGGPDQLREYRKESPPAEQEWTDPSHRLHLPEPLDDIDRADLERSVTQLEERRVLVIDCIDSDLQWAAAAAVVGRLSVSLPTVGGVVSGETNDRDGRSRAADDRARWTKRDIWHPKLGSGPCLLLLELDGSYGQNLLELIFKFKVELDELSARLKQCSRYLIILPKGRMPSPLFGGRSSRDLLVRPLRIDFLRPWLRRRFGAKAEAYAEAISAYAERSRWGVETLYEWLCGEVAKDGDAALDRLLKGSEEKPTLLGKVNEALDDPDGTSEPFLAAIFVATYLPGLSQHDFFRAVEALLTGRTRSKLVDAPVTDTLAPRKRMTVEIALADEWRDRFRAIMKAADLELRPGSGGKTIWFRDLPAAQLKATLDASPMFVEHQLERIRDAGLLFDPSKALSEAVIELVVGAAAEEPGRFDADWMVGLIIRARADMRNVPLTPQTAEMHVEDLGVRHLGAAEMLLRKLIAAEAARAEPAKHGTPELSLVDRVLRRLFRLGNGAVAFLLELTYRLRNAWGIDLWDWLRQVFDQGNEAARRKAAQMLDRVLKSEETDPWFAFRQVTSWLPEPGKNGGQAAAAAAHVVAGWATASIQFASGARTRNVAASVSLIQQIVAKEAAAAPNALAAALFHPQVIELLVHEQLGQDEPAPSELTDVMIGPISGIAGILLPPESADVEVFASALESWLEAIFVAWNQAVDDALEDAEELDLPRYLIPALALTAWSEMFAGRDDVVRALAAKVRAGQTRTARIAVQTWLGVLIAVMKASEDRILAIHDLREETRARLFLGTSERRERIARLQQRVRSDRDFEGGGDKP